MLGWAAGGIREELGGSGDFKALIKCYIKKVLCDQNLGKIKAVKLDIDGRGTHEVQSLDETFSLLRVAGEGSSVPFREVALVRLSMLQWLVLYLDT